MTFQDGKMPASTDMVKLVSIPKSPDVWVRCVICDQPLGRVSYLNQAIKMWADHQAQRDHAPAPQLETCFYCEGKIRYLKLSGFGHFWLIQPETPFGSAICPAREDDNHSPVEEHDDDEA